MNHTLIALVMCFIMFTLTACGSTGKDESNEEIILNDLLNLEQIEGIKLKVAGKDDYNLTSKEIEQFIDKVQDYKLIYGSEDEDSTATGWEYMVVFTYSDTNLKYYLRPLYDYSYDVKVQKVYYNISDDNSFNISEYILILMNDKIK